jgi:ElaB/YqjD/DUF883 family membrane-anchored ribosome-binding protein
MPGARAAVPTGRAGHVCYEGPKGIRAVVSMDKTAEDVHDQISRLREQVETLMKDRVTPMVTEAAGRAESAMHTATNAVRSQAEALTGQVREQPLLAVLLAVGVGYLIGRLSR